MLLVTLYMPWNGTCGCAGQQSGANRARPSEPCHPRSFAAKTDPEHVRQAGAGAHAAQEPLVRNLLSRLACALCWAFLAYHLCMLTPPRSEDQATIVRSSMNFAMDQRSLFMSLYGLVGYPRCCHDTPPPPPLPLSPAVAVTCHALSWETSDA